MRRLPSRPPIQAAAKNAISMQGKQYGADTRCYKAAIAASTSSRGGQVMDNIFFVSLVVLAFSLGGWSAGMYRQEPAMISGGIVT